ncbi:MAG TPA: DUF1801 domain-containing protein [Chloroflexia bacterium]|nr:DUF1801 domain-containing protein [Chloroflexia bacterium]
MVPRRGALVLGYACRLPEGNPIVLRHRGDIEWDDNLDNNGPGFASIDEYIARFPEDTKVLLEMVRAAIRDAAPQAEERISYQMPTFTMNGNLVHFAAWKNHIGFYPASGGALEAFKDELSQYGTSKGSIRFPVGQPLPLELISRIVSYRVGENLGKSASKARKKDA